MIKIWRFLLLALLSSQLLAETLYVRDGEYTSIQAAIDDAEYGDVIIVDPNTYYENIDFSGKAITVRSIDPNDPNIVAATIINGSTPTDVNNASVVTFKNGEGNDSILTGFTITGGTGTWLVIAWRFHEPYWNRCGGGVVCYNMSEPTITKNVFSNNTTGEGGGIYIYGDHVNLASPSNPSVHVKPIISDNIFINNSAIKLHGFSPPNEDYPDEEHGDGGAIVGFQGIDATITGNIIQNNHADYYGGGIHLRQWSNGEISNNQITGNDSMLGAGIHITYTSSPVIADNLIKSNVTIGGGGGGIYIYYYSNPLIENNVIIRNEDAYSAIGMYWSSNPRIRNNLIVKNIGLGILCKSGSAGTIINNTISDNYDNMYSGGIKCTQTSNPVIENNIITSNQGTGDVWTDGAYGIAADSDISSKIKYNNVWGNEEGEYGRQLADQTGINGNISVEPEFVDEPNDDYYLKSAGWRWDMLRNRWDYDGLTSRCIDAGNPGCDLADELLAVPDDPNGEWAENIRINMGAFGGTLEASLGPHNWALQADINNDGIVDLQDFAAFAEFWFDSGDRIPADFSHDSAVDFSDLGFLVEDWILETVWY